MSHIVFYEGPHKYVNTENGHEYKSATRFLHDFQTPFDEVGISKRCALKEGVSQSEILNRWHEKRDWSCFYGTQVHALMEKYIKNKETIEHFHCEKGKFTYDMDCGPLYESFNDICGEMFKYAQGIHSEYLLFHDESEIAGTADLIIDHNNNEFSVGDFKTNEEIEFFSKYNDHLLTPVGHLSACNYNIYTLQLSLYAYFYSLLTGKKVRHLFIMYKAPNTNRWKKIPCNYMLYEVAMMLKYYKTNIKN